MSWGNKLIETYDKCLGDSTIFGIEDLLPIGYTSQVTNLEITINDSGDFISAKIDLKRIPMPILTFRTSGIAPLPLCDKVHYCAGDYVKFKGQKKTGYTQYLNLLKDWCDKFPTIKTNAVYAYVVKGTLIQDLINCNICKVVDQKLIEQLGKEDPGDLFIRWKVNTVGNPCSAVWEDNDIVKSWEKYISSIKIGKKNICILSGITDSLQLLHPGKIRNEGDNAKLISSNDKSNFTYRGLFHTAEQAASISFINSEKLHKTLKWLVARQGIKNEDQVIVCWSTDGKLNDLSKKMHEDSLDLFGDQIILEQSSIGDVGKLFAQKLKNATYGFNINFSDIPHAMILGLDSVSTGRLAITYYSKLKGSDLLDNIQLWHSKTSWNQIYFKNKELIKFYGTPSVKDIAYCAYGEMIGKKPKFLKNIRIELTNCITNGYKIPLHLVTNSVNRTFKFNNFTPGAWKKYLGITCSIYKNYNEGNYSMALDTTITSRNYLFGRMLAISDHIEKLYLQLQGQNRSTNSLKLLDSFSKKPMTTWLIITKTLNNFRPKLLNSKYKTISEDLFKLIDTIISSFNSEDYNDDHLNGECLLGYSCQAAKLEQEKQERINKKEEVQETNAN